MEDRRHYQKEFRQRMKEKKRILKEAKPGQFIRDNPDYDRIIEAIEEEKQGEEK